MRLRTLGHRVSPRFAAWLVSLFGSSEQAESILGDLAEAFLDIVAKSGTAHARRWHWRQSLRSIVHLAGRSFRTAPWSLAGAALLGVLLRRCDFQLPERIIVAILRAQRPYSNLHYGFYIWQVTYGIPIACVVTSLLVGCVVAFLAKGREVVAVLTLIVVSAVPLLWLLLFVYKGADRDPAFAAAFHFFVFRWAFDVIGILVAGVLIRKLRSASSRPLAVGSFAIEEVVTNASPNLYGDRAHYCRRSAGYCPSRPDPGGLPKASSPGRVH